MQRNKDAHNNLSLDSPELNDIVGRLLIAGFEGNEFSPELEKLLTEVRPAGIIFFKRNYPHTPDKLKSIIDQAKALARQLTGRELFVAIDHEGGLVQRLPDPYTKLGSAEELAALDNPQAAGELVEASVRELAACGFNFNFAPVLDVSSPISSFVGSRSFGSNPQKVAEYGLEFVMALNRCGLLAAAKHFPGLGSASLDPHYELPSINIGREQLANYDLPPFQALIDAGLLAVMTSHAVYPALGDAGPATFSPSIVKILKQDMSFKGALISDDLEMGAVLKHHGIGRAAVMAVRAGHDLLLVCRRREYIDSCRYDLSKAIINAEISTARLDDAFSRAGLLLRRLKEMEIQDSVKMEWFRRLTACQSL